MLLPQRRTAYATSASSRMWTTARRRCRTTSSPRMDSSTPSWSVRCATWTAGTTSRCAADRAQCIMLAVTQMPPSSERGVQQWAGNAYRAYAKAAGALSAQIRTPYAASLHSRKPLGLLPRGSLPHELAALWLWMAVMPSHCHCARLCGLQTLWRLPGRLRRWSLKLFTPAAHCCRPFNSRQPRALMCSQP